MPNPPRGSLQTSLRVGRGHAAETTTLAPLQRAYLPKHIHETYQVSLYAHAPGLHRIEGQVVRAGVGSFVVVNPGDVHEGLDLEVGETPQTYLTLYLDLSALEGEPAVRPDALDNARHFEALRALHAGRYASALQEDEAWLAAGEALRSMGGLLPARWTGYADLRRAREIIHDRVGEAIRLEELAREAGLSPAHLVRAFRRAYGLPPHRYQLALRVERSRAMLAQGIGPTECAALLGFDDSSHLARHFRRLVGVGPLAFKRSISSRPVLGPGS